MKKLLFAGAIALALFGLAPATLTSAQATEADTFASGQQAMINLNRMKAVLRLSAEQQAYLPPVEAALADIAREQSSAAATSNGYIARIKRGIVAVTMNSAALARLAHAARPLLASLDDRQRQAARGLAREMGLGAMVAALN